MKLQGVSLEQLLKFLERSESPENLVGIAKMTIQENTKEEGSLDVTLVMVGVERTSNEAGR
jgi:general secretion pathway protein M